MGDYEDEMFEEEDTNKTLETLETEQIGDHNILDNIVGTSSGGAQQRASFRELPQRVSFQEFEEKSMTHQLVSLSNRKKRAANDAQLLL